MDQLATRMKAYGLLTKPSANDRKTYVTDQPIYQSFSGPITDGQTFGNPVTLQLVIAMASEERAGEIGDPVNPSREDAAWVALRLQSVKRPHRPPKSNS